MLLLMIIIEFEWPLQGKNNMVLITAVLRKGKAMKLVRVPVPLGLYQKNQA